MRPEHVRLGRLARLKQPLTTLFSSSSSGLPQKKTTPLPPSFLRHSVTFKCLHVVCSDVAPEIGSTRELRPYQPSSQIKGAAAARLSPRVLALDRWVKNYLPSPLAPSAVPRPLPIGTAVTADLHPVRQCYTQAPERWGPKCRFNSCRALDPGWCRGRP
ncbi:uncharacterized protein BO80DRAFT_272320 [Aspergillus ibericus CBS 121593]|uniref:Uncharacterized protein n=1 Tax=Aspergillus ibericus CBS 121593 TaxID=1448316 RepID=A0A395H799_9EURO|nr:hypothetical protein BO80DRAFT_272320 [Aspergillus ibericus CBS 121593]RAL03821.1 hypothetical protein BO80DRAFT_272320 [Aspergillus ibericus CBS 121593]